MSSITELLLSHGIELVVVIVTPVLLVLARKLILLLESKMGIDLAEKQEKFLNDLVLQGIAYAEEQARKALKSGSPAPSPDDKRAMAIEYVYEQMKKNNLAEVAGDLVSKKLEAWLNVSRPR